MVGISMLELSLAGGGRCRQPRGTTWCHEQTSQETPNPFVFQVERLQNYLAEQDDELEAEVAPQAQPEHLA